MSGEVDPRNRLNDLTGREWVYALRSVISTSYPTSGPESYAHDLRRAHPSPKPPQLLAELVRFFTRRGGHVLDPFAGVGGTLLACTLEARTAVMFPTSYACSGSRWRCGSSPRSISTGFCLDSP